MADVDYSYTKSPVAVDRLDLEIRQSLIITALRHVSLLGTNQVTVTMADTLSDGDKTLLDGVVAAHAGTSLIYPPQLIKIDQPVDSDNMVISRNKVTKTGWTFNRANVKFETGGADSLRYKSVTMADLAGVTLKFFNAAGTDISTAGQTTLTADCVITQMDFEPPYDNEIIAGSIVLFSDPLHDMWLTVIGLPDVPASYGGSKEFVTDEALHMLGAKKVLTADGRASKPLSYNPAYHTNKLRAVIRHEPGDRIRIQMTYQQFKS
jgi:hypothetical protein